MDYVDDELATLALERAEGPAFERFAQSFLSSLYGRDFVPVGGVMDGGVDGIYHGEGERTFYQITRQENHRDKIRKTFRRLCETERDVRILYYVSSRLIPSIDKEEDSLQDELGVTVKIRDRKYIVNHINDNIGTIAAYNNHIASYVNFIHGMYQRPQRANSPHVEDPAPYVFLQNEITHRLGKRKLVHSVTDTLILWALSDTNPDAGIFMTEEDIQRTIFDFFPWADKLLKPYIRERLEELRTKRQKGREIRWYKKDQKYCLPYETRLAISKESDSNEIMEVEFLDEIKATLGSLFDADDGEYQLCSRICLRAIHLVFEKQGLLFAHFLSSDDVKDAPPVVSDCVDIALDEANIKGSSVEEYREHIERTIRFVFYESTPIQRGYLNSLSKTYVLLFSLQAEPRVIEFFSNMTGNFDLYLGSDILVKALSERYLSEEDQVARNVLRMASEMGVNLYLSECVLEEVYTHVRATYYEFINYFSEMEPYITQEIARNADKILIRTYFYAKESGHVRGWKEFINQFVTYDNVTGPQGRHEIRDYLTAEFGLTFVDNSELEEVVSTEQVEALADSLIERDDKENRELAYNTALLVHGIYGLRRTKKESAQASEFGFRTWWMTNQTRVLRHTSDIVRKNGSNYVMRPEFLLNFIALAPSAETVRENFGRVFPSVFGIQLGHRLRPEAFHEIMEKVAEWKGLEEGRIKASMASMSNRLKSDRLKRYEQEF